MEHQREIDDLQLKLANLDLKYKQLQLDDNRESHAIQVTILLILLLLLLFRDQVSAARLIVCCLVGFRKSIRRSKRSCSRSRKRMNN